MQCNKEVKMKFHDETYFCDRTKDHHGNCDSWQKRKRLDLDTQIANALEAEINPKQPYTLWDRIFDLIFQFNPQINDPIWLAQKYHDEHMTTTQIAKIVGCSERLVDKKMRDQGVLSLNKVIDVYTGHWHHCKQFISMLASPHIKKIERSTNAIYHRTKSRNAGIFKEIIADLEKYDNDKEGSSFQNMGYTRKALYILAAKFLVCLYEYDSYYFERMDYVIKKILERKEDIYIDDEMANPDNWYPHRNTKVVMKYLIMRNK